MRGHLWLLATNPSYPTGSAIPAHPPEDLVVDFCESPPLLELQADVIVDLLEERRQFILQKKGLGDKRGQVELDERLDTVTSPAVPLGIDDSISFNHPW